MISTAFVNIWNNRAGAIAWDSLTGLASFEFDPAFMSKNWDLSPLKMPLSEAGNRIFNFPETVNTRTFKGLPGLLADSMPDNYGNAIINAWLARRGRPSDSMNPVEILCFIGKRGMGALEFEPAIPRISGASEKIEINDLVEVANDILTGRMSFTTTLSENEEKALLDILKIGTSAGGARAKALIAYNPVTNEVRSGQVTSPKGFTHWIIKFDGVADSQFGASHGYGRVEMAYYHMAKDSGIEMTECRLFEEHGRAHFMTCRYDRDDNKGKIHAQSLCAIQHFDFNDVASFSYEQLFETMRLMGLPYPQAEQMFRRMVFNVIARNCDDHTKNFAFLMDQSGVWKLAPAFDLCHSFRPGSAWVSQQSLSVNGKRTNIGKEDLLIVASQMNIKKAGIIIAQINDIVQHWSKYAAETSVDKTLSGAINKTLIKLT